MVDASAFVSPVSAVGVEPARGSDAAAIVGHTVPSKSRVGSGREISGGMAAESADGSVKSSAIHVSQKH